MKRFHHGFTIVELVTVMVILGVLSAIAIPRLVGDNAFAGITYRQTVVAALHHAQKSAVSHRRLVCAKSSPATNVTLRIASTNPASACDLTLASPDGTAYTSNAANIVTGGLLASDLYFQPDGRITSDGAGTQSVSGAITITNQGSITVNGTTGYVE